jgi:hypothetical protein
MSRIHDSIDRLSCLSSDETALILQYLDNASRIAAAVTCRRMMRDVLQPFSWKYAEGVSVTHKQLSNCVRLHPCSLLQLAPVQVEHLREGDTCPSVHLDSVRRLFGITVDDHGDGTFTRLLQHPVGQQVRQIRCMGNRSDFSALVTLPRLTSLEICWMALESTSSVSALLSLLLSRTNLTELSYGGGYPSSSRGFSHAIRDSQHHLRRVHMFADVFDSHNPHHAHHCLHFDTFFATPTMAQIQVLSLLRLQLNDVTERTEFRTALQSLHILHTLFLSQGKRIASTLPLLSAASALTRLRVRQYAVIKPRILYALQGLHAAMPRLYTMFDFPDYSSVNIVQATVAACAHGSRPCGEARE